MPNILELQADNFFRFGRKKISSKSTHRFSVHASQIQCDLKDVAYWFKKKEGFPSLSDTGIVDIFLGGHGLSFTLKLATAEKKDRNRIFKIENVNVVIKGLNIVLKKSTHKTLFNFFRPLLMGIMKPLIVKAAEVQIRKSFDQVDEQLYAVQKEYEKARDKAQDQSPEESANMVNQYIQAIQTRFNEKKEKAKEKAPQPKVCGLQNHAYNQVNIATTKETSMFPKISLPDGISTQATKYREMSREGNEWRSPVFDLGTANPTRIPEPEKITRKSPHEHSRATINDRPGSETHGRGVNTGNQGAYGSSSNTGGYSGDFTESGGAATAGTTGLGAIGGSRSGGGYIPSGLGSNSYEPRQSSASDSMSTAVDDQNEFEGTHVGKYNVSGSQLPQDPQYSSAKNTNVASQDPSRQVY
jgi:Protein of unknown function (DUF4449)/Family of unknown function (DUF5923)